MLCFRDTSVQSLDHVEVCVIISWRLSTGVAMYFGDCVFPEVLLTLLLL